MSSTLRKCSLCKGSLGKDNKKEVTTSCKHTFHRECAEQFIKSKSNDCPTCNKISALKNALTKDPVASSRQHDSVQSKNTKNNEKTDHVASPMMDKSRFSNMNANDNDEDEWECTNCSTDNSASSKRCQSCGQSKNSTSSVVNSAAASSLIEESYDQKSQSIQNQRSHRGHRHSNVVTEDDYEDHTTTNSQRWNRQESTEWTCEQCDYDNWNSNTVCKNCNQSRQSENESGPAARQSNRPLPPVHHSPVASSSSSKSIPKRYPELDYDGHSSSQSYSDQQPVSKVSSTSTSSKKDITSSESAHASSAKSKSSKEKTQPSTSSSTSMHAQHRIPVYISDLPLDVDDDRQLASHIQHRVEKALRIEPIDIKCYSKLGVGVMYVSSNEIKDDLIDSIGSLALHPKEGKHTISFVDTVEFVSYIVLDVPKEKTDPVLPTTEEISRRWTELYKGEKPLDCEQLNIQFPNIYRLVSTSLDQLISALDHQDLKIKSYFARIYICADCSFFEDLPRSITHDQLQTAIANAIKLPHIPSSSLYIQLNKQAGNACIITAGIARKWAATTFLYLGDKPISKKENLTCRLLVRPVPHTLSPASIITHSDFSGKATIYKHSGESLILEISDKNVFDECVKRGALRVANKYMLSLDSYSASINPDGSEIDGDTWYDTEMSKYKPDIMQFVANPEHDIFRYKWNSKIWLEQFEKATPEKFSVDFPKDPRGQRGTPIDQIRHQLQVTVMLNTLATIRKKSYFIKDREVKLNLNNNLKTIVYNHQSKLEKGVKMPIKSPPFTKTTVHVVKDDCVVVYEQLLKKGKRPVLLNMASATSPGGGFRKGDGAQEENLFRRSDYFRSLDVGLDDFLPQRSERLRCSSDGRLEPLPEPHTMYPMDEYSAIYTSGLTFFRHSQDVGYEYMNKPIENVCAIAMAAYRDPKLDGKLLASKYAVGTRKKIENVFSIAYHHKHDSLVLSAFGCGAFRNPPIHVAQIFSSVIDQYAGFFDSIVFAILDDHNAGQRLNPEGNYKPFADIFDDKKVIPLTPMNKPNTMFGPYRISYDGSTVNDVCILDLTPCNYGAKCSDIRNATHIHQYSHPPLCNYAAIKGTCDSTNDIAHMNSFIHRNHCPYGGECWHIDDKKHTQDLEHPSYCPQGSSCKDMEKDHLKKFRHLPLCKYAQKCVDYKKHAKQHCESFRHCQPHCRHGNNCVNFHDKKHLDEEEHPFPPPCPRTPFHCQSYIILSEATEIKSVSFDVQQHCLDFAHVCRFGRNCKDNSPLHREKSIHIARRLCPYDGKCIKLIQEEHLNSYTHSNIADIRRVCKNSDKCYEPRKLDHIVKFRHSRSHEDSGVVRYYGLNNDIDFVQNQTNSITRVLNYVKNQNWKPVPPDSIPSEILDWFRTVQPVHRCNPVIFESILLHGHVMSRDYMEHLKKPKFVANSVMQHSRIRRIQNLHIPQYAQHAREYITAVVTAEFDKANFPPPESKPGETPAPPPPPRPDSASHAKLIKTKEKVLLSTILSSELDALRTKAIEIAQASIKLFSNPAGIGHAPDKELGTAKHVFSILGPHQGHYYGDVFIVFKRDILHHPDADFSIQAATTCLSGNAYKWRPWLGSDPGTPEERVKLYHSSKLHTSIPGYEYAIALELMAITSNELKLNSMNMDLQTIFKRWLGTDSHRTIEAHLPQLIPLDYIDHIYIPQNIYNSLNAQTRRAIDAVFKYSISVTPHQGDANQEMGPFRPMPTSKERADYQSYVVDELLKQYNRDVKNPPARPIQGTIITIPATGLNDSFVLPLTISQAYEQYRIENQKKPAENIAYIYWQVMHGDMMLVLSNEQIDSDKDQTKLRCLLCYIAPKCESYDSSYFEQATYLNCGQPIQHQIFVTKNQYKVKSNTFHIGCNTDDFITYCLEIHRSTGKVILRQAGSNAIYNHEEIVYDFTNKELDVAKLDFIHLSANANNVSVRNLIVSFEKQMDLHPTYDKDFKRSTSSSPTASSGDHSHDSSSLKPCPENVNCLIQYETGASGTSHNSKFSHPCRFSELCRNKESYLTHDPHPSSLCSYDKGCNKLTDPFHRAEYRHTDQPDFLVPCRNQNKCSDKSNEHRIKYSHGEQVFGKKGGGGGAAAASSTSEHPSTDHRKPCKYGSECKTIADASHRAEYSHNKS